MHNRLLSRQTPTGNTCVLATPTSVATISAASGPRAPLPLEKPRHGETVERHLPRTLQAQSIAVRRASLIYKQVGIPVQMPELATPAKTSARPSRPTLGAIGKRIAGVLSPRRRPFAMP